MKTSQIIFTQKYNDGFVEYHYKPWYLPMSGLIFYFRYFCGKNIQIKRIQDYEK